MLVAKLDPAESMSGCLDICFRRRGKGEESGDHAENGQDNTYDVYNAAT